MARLDWDRAKRDSAQARARVDAGSRKRAHIKLRNAGAGREVTPKQLSYLRSLAAKLGKPKPDPENRQQASLLIQQYEQMLAVKRSAAA